MPTANSIATPALHGQGTELGSDYLLAGVKYVAECARSSGVTIHTWPGASIWQHINSAGKQVHTQYSQSTHKLETTNT